MGHPKKSKSTGKSSQKHALAKQAMKKKHRGAAKFQNDQLRAALDSQALTVYPVRPFPRVYHHGFDGNHLQMKEISHPSLQPTDLIFSDVSVNELTATLVNLSSR